ncbi:MAG TPA: Na+/H+ antiporter subunit B [Sandaracinaceae bacterium LLY-WYZ-13_1]|nr:Na+/H+ antiporter subunit B [Sandaracinaceae bacterium LLY-WYZ-13_1]
MRSVKLETTARILQPLILFFSVFLLLQGHDGPGGGFVGGLTAAAAFTLHGLAYGNPSARASLKLRVETFAAVGVAIVMLTAIAPMFWGAPMLTATWGTLDLGSLGTAEVGTPLLFDAGIYLVVMGATLMIVLTLGEE